LWEIPNGVTSGLPIPLNATALAILGDRASAILLRQAAKHPDPLVFVFHGVDLVDFDTQLRDDRLRHKAGLPDPIEHKLRRVERTLQILGKGRTWVRLVDLVTARLAGSRHE